MEESPRGVLPREARNLEIQYRPSARSRLAPQSAIGSDGYRLADFEEQGKIVYRVAVEGAVREGDASAPREGEDGVAFRGAEEGRAREPARAATVLEFEAARQDRLRADVIGQGPHDEVERGSGQDDGPALGLDRGYALEQLGAQRLPRPRIEDLPAYG